MGRTARDQNLCLTCKHYACEWLTKGGVNYIDVVDCSRYEYSRSTETLDEPVSIQAELPYGD